MNRKGWFALVAVWGCLIMAPASGYGSGFALFEAGARGSALMCTMVARADDPSAIFYNPAGLVQLPGFQVMGGFSFIVPRVEIVTHSGSGDTRTLMDSQVSLSVPCTLGAGPRSIGPRRPLNAMCCASVSDAS